MNSVRVWLTAPAVLTLGAFLCGCQPRADFALSEGIRTAPAHVAFENQSSGGAGTVWAYEWDFGDGVTSDEANPAHVYEREGVYNVTLTVKSASGSHTMTKVAAVVVTDDLPVEAEASHAGCYLAHAATPWAAQDAHRYNVYAAVSPMQGKMLRSLPEGGFGSRAPSGVGAEVNVPEQLASNE